ncbi:MAG: hypothetical protein ACPIOQ_53520, partial [Promethearchaeia archaeon]
EEEEEPPKKNDDEEEEEEGSGEDEESGEESLFWDETHKVAAPWASPRALAVPRPTRRPFTSPARAGRRA